MLHSPSKKKNKRQYTVCYLGIFGSFALISVLLSGKWNSKRGNLNKKSTWVLEDPSAF